MKKIVGILAAFVAVVTLMACSQEQSFIVNETSINIDRGETYTIDIDALNVGDITYESTDESVFTVSNNGVITGIAHGVATVRIIPSDDTFEAVEVLVTVIERIELSVEDDALTLKEGESALIDYTSNNNVSFSSSDETIVSVDSTGGITAHSIGEAVITITVIDDTSVTHDVVVTVTRLLTIDGSSEQKIWVDGTLDLNIIANDDVTFISSDNSVVRVSQDGIITGISKGHAVITVTSDIESSVTFEIEVGVYLGTELIFITGEETVNIGSLTQFDVEVAPEEGYPSVRFEVSDDSIASIDATGTLTPHKVGTVTVTVYSLFNEDDKEISAETNIEIVHYIAVDKDASANDTREYNGFTYIYGETLFSSIAPALSVSQEGLTLVVFEGDYSEDITLDKDNTSFVTNGEVTFDGELVIAADGVLIDGVHFINASSITNGTYIEGFSFINNTITALNSARDAFIDFDHVGEMLIEANHFNDFSFNAVQIMNIETGVVRIFKNIMSEVDNGIVVHIASTAKEDISIQIERNELFNLAEAINVDLNGQTIHLYARFNALHDVNKNVILNEENSFDFTLNYWGSTTLDESMFDNVEAYYLRGFYETQSSIISERNYDPEVPVKIIITNPIDELVIGDSHTITYDVLPLDLDTSRIRFITSNPDVLMVTQTGVLTPIGSGPVTITVRSSANLSINDTMRVDVTTTPGIELKTDHIMNTTLVGDTFTLEAQPFPYDIRDSDVVFESSDELIATIDEFGVVTAHTAGVVTLTGRLATDMNVYTEYTFEVFTALDENNLLDLLTMNQVTYSTPHEWIAYGFTFNYVDFRYESVSRFYFSEELAINERIVPVFYGIRPGSPMDPHPDGITAFNNENVYWVVIHDTANTSPGAGALAHANYLYNAAVNQNALYTSWHYTIDDTYIYQHIPENERAFHAGDGSSRPGTSSTYLGGGNRNGIGIEMAVNQDGDMYRTWQRTAQLASDILVRYNLPLDHLTYHIDFSGKICPQTLIRAGLIDVFEEMAAVEYQVRSNFNDAMIAFESHNPEYLDNTGRIIEMPDRAMTVSYTITVEHNGVAESRTFYTYLPGTIH